jgi:hypothetical protein
MRSEREETISSPVPSNLAVILGKTLDLLEGKPPSTLELWLPPASTMVVGFVLKETGAPTTMTHREEIQLKVGVPNDLHGSGSFRGHCDNVASLSVHAYGFSFFAQLHLTTLYEFLYRV